MRAHASCRSFSLMSSRAIARSICVSASVATWWPRPREPECIMTHTWPTSSRPMREAADLSKISSTTWTTGAEEEVGMRDDAGNTRAIH